MNGDLLGMMTADISLIVGPPQSSGGVHRIRGDHAAEAPMFAIGLGFLALFSVISILLGNEDPRPGTDPRIELPLWARYGMR
jgi:hypothetical protein